MPIAVIPPQLRKLAEGHDRVALDARDVAQLIDELDRRFPGMAARLRSEDALRAGLAVAVDGTVSGRGLWQKLAPDSEVHFLPAIGGG